MSTPAKRSETFLNLVSRQPDNELFRFSLAQAYVAECRYLDAADQFKYCVNKKPDWMMARIHLGKLYLELGKQPEAVVQFQEALKLAVEQDHQDPAQELRGILDDLAKRGHA